MSTLNRIYDSFDPVKVAFQELERIKIKRETGYKLRIQQRLLELNSVEILRSKALLKERKDYYFNLAKRFNTIYNTKNFLRIWLHITRLALCYNYSILKANVHFVRKSFSLWIHHCNMIRDIKTCYFNSCFRIFKSRIVAKRNKTIKLLRHYMLSQRFYLIRLCKKSFSLLQKPLLIQRRVSQFNKQKIEKAWQIFKGRLLSNQKMFWFENISKVLRWKTLKCFNKIRWHTRSCILDLKGINLCSKKKISKFFRILKNRTFLLLQGKYWTHFCRLHSEIRLCNVFFRKLRQSVLLSKQRSLYFNEFKMRCKHAYGGRAIFINALMTADSSLSLMNSAHEIKIFSLGLRKFIQYLDNIKITKKKIFKVSKRFNQTYSLSVLQWALYKAVVFRRFVRKVQLRILDKTLKNTHNMKPTEKRKLRRFFQRWKYFISSFKRKSGLTVQSFKLMMIASALHFLKCSFSKFSNILKFKCKQHVLHKQILCQLRLSRCGIEKLKNSLQQFLVLVQRRTNLKNIFYGVEKHFKYKHCCYGFVRFRNFTSRLKCKALTFMKCKTFFCSRLIWKFFCEWKIHIEKVYMKQRRLRTIFKNCERYFFGSSKAAFPQFSKLLPARVFLRRWRKYLEFNQQSRSLQNGYLQRHCELRILRKYLKIFKETTITKVNKKNVGFRLPHLLSFQMIKLANNVKKRKHSTKSLICSDNFFRRYVLKKYLLLLKNLRRRQLTRNSNSFLLEKKYFNFFLYFVHNHAAERRKSVQFVEYYHRALIMRYFVSKWKQNYALCKKVSLNLMRYAKKFLIATKFTKFKNFRINKLKWRTRLTEMDNPSFRCRREKALQFVRNCRDFVCYQRHQLEIFENARKQFEKHLKRKSFTKFLLLLTKYSPRFSKSTKFTSVNLLLLLRKVQPFRIMCMKRQIFTRLKGMLAVKSHHEKLVQRNLKRKYFVCKWNLFRKLLETQKQLIHRGQNLFSILKCSCFVRKWRLIVKCKRKLLNKLIIFNPMFHVKYCEMPLLRNDRNEFNNLKISDAMKIQKNFHNLKICKYFMSRWVHCLHDVKLQMYNNFQAIQKFSFYKTLSAVNKWISVVLFVKAREESIVCGLLHYFQRVRVHAFQLWCFYTHFKKKYRFEKRIVQHIVAKYWKIWYKHHQTLAISLSRRLMVANASHMPQMFDQSLCRYNVVLAKKLLKKWYRRIVENRKYSQYSFVYEQLICKRSIQKWKHFGFKSSSKYAKLSSVKFNFRSLQFKRFITVVKSRIQRTFRINAVKIIVFRQLWRKWRSKYVYRRNVSRSLGNIVHLFAAKVFKNVFLKWKECTKFEFFLLKMNQIVRSQSLKFYLQHFQEFFKISKFLHQQLLSMDDFHCCFLMQSSLATLRQLGITHRWKKKILIFSSRFYEEKSLENALQQLKCAVTLRRLCHSNNIWNKSRRGLTKCFVRWKRISLWKVNLKTTLMYANEQPLAPTRISFLLTNFERKRNMRKAFERLDSFRVRSLKFKRIFSIRQLDLKGRLCKFFSLWLKHAHRHKFIMRNIQILQYFERILSLKRALRRWDSFSVNYWVLSNNNKLLELHYRRKSLTTVLNKLKAFKLRQASKQFPKMHKF